MVSATFPGAKAAVTIHTVTLRGACAKACPESREWAIAGAKQVSVVEGITISVSVNGRPVPAPYPGFVAAFEPHVASLQSEKGRFVLRIEGGDGAYSYVDLLYFDSRGAKELKVYSGMYPVHPIEVTRYYPIALDP